MKNDATHVVIVLVLLLIGAETLGQTTAASPRRIELQCGQHKVAITCGKVSHSADPQDNRQCNHNTLSFSDSRGKVFVPKQPKNFRQEFVVEKTPVSMACAQGKDGRYYTTVEFSACPLNSNYAACTTYDLFASNGQRLTVNSRNLDLIKAQRAISYTKLIRIEGDIK